MNKHWVVHISIKFVSVIIVSESKYCHNSWGKSFIVLIVDMGDNLRLFRHWIRWNSTAHAFDR